MREFFFDFDHSSYVLSRDPMPFFFFQEMENGNTKYVTYCKCRRALLVFNNYHFFAKHNKSIFRVEPIDLRIFYLRKPQEVLY